jgi:hypothetical protein
VSDPIPFPGPQRQVTGGNGDGRDFDARLRTVEGDVREIKTRMETVATKSDIKELASSMKIWILSSSVVALVIVVGWLVTWIVRLSTG